MTCPANPPSPNGFRVWRKPVPQPLVDWAVYLRDLEMSRVPYGFEWGQDYTPPGSNISQQVVARKDYHTYTFRNGRLLTGICIPGITLYEGVLSQTTGASTPDDLTTPDPNAALFSVDTDAAGNPTVPIDQETAPNVGLIVGSGLAFAAVVGLFVAAVTHKIP